MERLKSRRLERNEAARLRNENEAAQFGNKVAQMKVRKATVFLTNNPSSKQDESQTAKQTTDRCLNTNQVVDIVVLLGCRFGKKRPGCCFHKVCVAARLQKIKSSRQT